MYSYLMYSYFVSPDFVRVLVGGLVENSYLWQATQPCSLENRLEVSKIISIVRGYNSDVLSFVL